LAVIVSIVYWQLEQKPEEMESEKSEQTVQEQAQKEYNEHITKGDVFAAQGEDSYKQAMAEYEAAIYINEQNNLGMTSANSKKFTLSQKIDRLVEDYTNRAAQFIDLLGADGRKDAIALLEKAQKLKYDNSIENKLDKLRQ
jgi:hypothetical protein